jgi:hypothetical protein
MPISLLLVSLSTIICIALALFYYFRKRIGVVERKVNLMFQLIQEHEKRAQTQSNIIIQQRRNEVPKFNPNVELAHDLISVSEDEEGDDDDAASGYTSGDSSEVSDTDDVLTFSENSPMPQLIGAEITKPDKPERTRLNVAEMLSGGYLEKPNISINKIEFTEPSQSGNIGVELHKVVGVTKYADTDDSEYKLQEGVELEGVELKGAELEGAELEGAELEGAELEGAELEGAVITLDNNEIDANSANDVAEKTSDASPLEGELALLRVTELKQRAGNMGLKRYSRLNKNSLVNLIVANSS